MIIVCFGRPFWEFHLKSINIFIVIIILLLVLLSLNIQNLLVLLSAVDLGGQNYIAALVFGTVYLGTFFILKQSQLEEYWRLPLEPYYYYF